MAAVSLTPEDLAPFADIEETKAEAMIEDAVARAALAAPCILSDEFTQEAAAKAIIRGAILRWHESGSGAVTQESIGSFSQTVDSRQTRRGLFWPSELDELKRLCADEDAGVGAFSIDSLSLTEYQHADICAVNFGANYCSCGAILAGVPLYEDDV